MTTEINLDNIAKELYGKLQARFPNLDIGDENGAVLAKKQDIPLARFFEFPYKVDGMTIGTMTITLDPDDGMVVQLGGDLVAKKHPDVVAFMKSMSAFAKPHLLNFKVVNLNKSNLDKRDYAFQAKRKEQPAPEPVMESKLYGTAKISYQDLGEARLVIKHTQPVNQELAAGRTMHIESIYIENTEGERFRYPYKHLNGARALAEHVKHGGNPYDEVGRYITGLSEELAQLRRFKGYVGRNETLAENMGDITSKVMERIEEIKKQVHGLQRKSYYESFVESYQGADAKEIPESIMNDWIDRLTVRTFNEDLKTVFPYIFKLVGESDIPVKGISPDDLLDEATGDADFDSMMGGITSNTSVADQSDGEELTNEVAHAFKVMAFHLNQRLQDEWEELEPEQQNKLVQTVQNLAHVSIYMRHLGLLGGIEKARHMGISDDVIDDVGDQVGVDLLGMLHKADGPEEQFESFVNRIMEDAEDQEGTDTLFSPNPEVQAAAVEKLNGLLATELNGGPDGVNAIQSMKGIIDDPEFIHMLSDLDPNLDSRPIIQQYILHRQADLLPQLHFGTAELGGEEPVGEEPPMDMAPPPEAAMPPEAGVPPAAPGGEIPPPAGAPAPAATPGMPPLPPQPMAEGEEDEIEDEGLEKWNAKRKFGANGARALSSARKAGSKPGKMSKLRSKFIKAWESGAQLEDVMDFGHTSMTVAEAIAAVGLTPMECGYDMPQAGDQVVVDDGRSGQQEIEDSIRGFWNAEEDNFTIGGTRAKIKVKKAYADGEYPNASIDDVKAVLAKIDSMDPSADEHGAIMKLAGVQQEPQANDMAVKVSSMGSSDASDSMAKILRLLGK